MEAVTRAAALTGQSRGWRVLYLCMITLVSMATSHLPAQGKWYEDGDGSCFVLQQCLGANAAVLLKESTNRTETRIRHVYTERFVTCSVIIVLICWLVVYLHHSCEKLVAVCSSDVTWRHHLANYNTV